MSNSKWKSRLLSSGFPLEYEVSKKLVEKNFSVDDEFSFIRQNENGDSVEFSIDNLAQSYFPFDQENEISGELILPIECKYRKRGSNWLFSKNTNKPSFSPVTVGATMRDITSSIYAVYPDQEVYIDSDVEFGFTGLEINLNTGDVHRKDIKHAILQLKYALPEIIKSNLSHYLNDIFNPILLRRYFCPILVTTAELWSLNSDINIDKVNGANSLEDLARKLPYLVAFSGNTPDFVRHHENVFQGFSEEVLSYKGMRNLLEDDTKQYDKIIEFFNDMSTSSNYHLNQYYQQFIICNLYSLDSLLNKLKETVTLTNLSYDSGSNYTVG